MKELVERRMQMRRGMWIGVVLLVVVGGIALGVGAYHAGVSHGLAQAGQAQRVVRVVGPGWGFFPFGFFLFPLFLFALFALARGAFWRRGWSGDHGPGGSGPVAGGRRAMFEDWHRRQHEERGAPSGAGGPPASV
jgi:hypothetical protein